MAYLGHFITLGGVMKILVSGLVNLETSLPIKHFPISYEPISYAFGSHDNHISGVGFNVSKALNHLGAKVYLTSIIGKDWIGKAIYQTIKDLKMSPDYLFSLMEHTAQSTVLYDLEGQRMIYCDLKGLQEMAIQIEPLIELIKECDLVIPTNINFSRPLLRFAKSMNKLVACDVHLVKSPNDPYNHEFMELADILFFSGEGKDDPLNFLKLMSESFSAFVIVCTLGGKGLLYWDRKQAKAFHIPAVDVKHIKNTIGAGDALFSAFCYYYLKGFDIQEALIYASHFASYKIGFSGGSQGFLTADELEKRVIQKKL